MRKLSVIRAMRLFVFTGLCFTVNISRAQNIRPLENVASPEVSSLGIYGEIPVSLFTGTPQISIPLYEIKMGHTIVPISADYHIGSVKPNIQEGCLGLGWSLVTGGYITRNVRGTYDEKCDKNGYASGYYAHSYKLKDITPEKLLEHTKHLTDEDKEYYELSADEFSFNFCGYSGNFYYNENKSWTVASDQPIRVLFDENDGFINLSQLRPEIKTNQWNRAHYNNRFFNKFTLVTPDGCKYIFGGIYATEYSISYYNRNNSDLIATSWFLSEIITPEGRHINYEYKSSGPQCDLRYSPQSRIVYNLECASPSLYDISRGRSGLTGFLLFPVLLKQIKTSNEIIDFIYTEDYGHSDRFYKGYLGWTSGDIYNRHNIFKLSQLDNDPIWQFQLFLNIRRDTEANLQEDIKNSLKWEKLHAICISPIKSGSFTKTYYFDYTYERRKLSLISERKGKFEEIPKYAYGNGTLYFVGYEIPTFPTTYVPKEYKFKYNNTLMPRRYVDADEDSWGFYNGKTIETSSELSFEIQSPNLTYAKAQTLTEIQYPTKGKVRLDYELNEYSKCLSPALNNTQDAFGYAGGLRISSFTTLSADDRIVNTKKYYYSKNKNNSESSGVLRTKPLFELLYYLAAEDPNSPYIELKSKNGFYTPVTNLNAPIVGYSCIIEETLDSLGRSQGYVKYKYSNYDTDIWGESHYDESAIFSVYKNNSYYSQFSSKSMERGKLLSEEYYNSKDVLIKSIKYKYIKSSEPENYLVTAYQDEVWFCYVNAISGISADLTKTYTYSYLLGTKTETMNTLGGTVTQNRTYNNRKLLKTETVHNSQNSDTYITNYTYPNDLVKPSTGDITGLSLSPYIKMMDANILNVPIEVYRTKNGKTINSIITTYKTGNELPVKDKEYQLEVQSGINDYSPLHLIDDDIQPSIDYRMQLYTSYGKYDTYNNPIEVTYKNQKSILLWGYYGQYLMSKIENATYDEVKSVLGMTPESLSLTSPSSKNTRDLRFKLKHSQVYSYTYLPPIGLISMADPKGEIIYYDYDSLGRYKGSFIYEDRLKRYVDIYNYDYSNK